MSGIAQLTGTVKHYDWGGTSFLADLLAVKNEKNERMAEYWLGVHPQADCKVLLPDSAPVLLRNYIEQDSTDTIGEAVQKRFGSIPYLLKALDVKDMLSIQVHPSKSAAEIDFDKEDATGVPLTAPNRNYKDRNHKPELMVAMGDFWLLHGFKPEDKLEAILNKIPELNFLSAVFKNKGYKELYKLVMELPETEVNARLTLLLERILPLYQAGKLDKSNEDYWAAKAHITFSKPGQIDRGLFSIYIFNVLNLKRGEAVFQDAGVPHAYMEGQNVEIMASSDNVLRGGLTTKHVDVVELLKHTKCEATHPNVLTGDKENTELVFHTAAPDFELSQLIIKDGASSFVAKSAEIILLMEGEAELISGSQSVILKKGQISAVAFKGAEVKVKAHENATIFKATHGEL